MCDETLLACVMYVRWGAARTDMNYKSIWIGNNRTELAETAGWWISMVITCFAAVWCQRAEDIPHEGVQINSLSVVIQINSFFQKNSDWKPFVLHDEGYIGC